jgi:hypothetical protein
MGRRPKPFTNADMNCRQKFFTQGKTARISEKPGPFCSASRTLLRQKTETMRRFEAAAIDLRSRHRHHANGNPALQNGRPQELWRLHE